jgi:intracellular multiplication protein IcmW
MPDLTRKGSHQFWKDYNDRIIYKVISFMESVETWTLDDDPLIESAIDELGRALDRVGRQDLKKEDEFITLCANIKMSRALRLLQCMDTANPGSASKLLIYAEQNSRDPDDPPGLFLRRNVVFERLRLLTRVFAQERINLVLRALEGEEG